MTRFLLHDGRIVEAEKDCGCLQHEGPHWLYMDRLWLEMNRAIHRVATDRCDQETDNCQKTIVAVMGWLGVARQEVARLTELEQTMRALGIAKILADDGETDDI